MSCVVGGSARSQPAQRSGYCAGLPWHTAVTLALKRLRARRRRTDERQKFDELVEDQGVRILIEPTAIMHVVGTKMDFVQDRLKCAPPAAYVVPCFRVHCMRILHCMCVLSGMVEDCLQCALLRHALCVTG
jgi:hypothetical protein